VGVFGRERRFAGALVQEIGKLLLVEHEEFNLRARVASLGSRLLEKGFITAAQSGSRGMSGNYEGHLHRRSNTKRSVQNPNVAADHRSADVIGRDPLSRDCLQSLHW
jgi:hypothetical protein